MSQLDELEGAGCRTTLHLDDDPEVEVHPVLVELALANLLRNAARHAPIRAAAPGEPDDRLFDRFARRGPRSGLGLGLSLAREVARRHGGDCTLRPVPTGGTRALLEVRR